MQFLKPFAATLFACALLLPHAWARANEVQVCFSPPLPGACDPMQTVVQAVNSAQHQVLVQAYSFTSAPIAKAVSDAKKRGLDVRVILDKSNARKGYSAATFLDHAGVPVLIDSSHAIGRTVITGSFNFTKAAEQNNAENLVLIQNPAIAEQYVQNWNAHAAHSQPLSAVSARLPHPSAREEESDGDNTPATPMGPIVGNRRSLIYAWPGCGSYNTMALQNRVVFPSAQAAEAAGYRAAHNCQ